MTILKGNCCICGRGANISSHKQIYCAKHYKQLQKYGYCVDSNPRTIHDPNEIVVDGNITYIKLYDRNCNEVAITIIDSEDLLRVQALK